MRVSVTTARNNLAKLLHLVENGERVTITRRGRPVVRLRKIPVRPLDDDPFAELVAGFEKEK
jgi:prevent-host-death family protein